MKLYSTSPRLEYPQMAPGTECFPIFCVQNNVTWTSRIGRRRFGKFVEEFQADIGFFVENFIYFNKKIMKNAADGQKGRMSNIFQCRK